MGKDLDPRKPMDAVAFHSACIKVFGSKYGWQSRVARALGTDPSSVSRWLGGTMPIPGPVRAAMRTWTRVGFKDQDSA
jgi:hypothetical protein